MRIHLLCDQKWRDLPSLVAIKIALEAHGHRVLLSTIKDALPMMKAFRPDCVVFHHLFSRLNQRIAAALRAEGAIVVKLPTEGAMRPELRPISHGSYSEAWPMDLCLAWSEPSAIAIRERWGLDSAAVPALGCTRFDFYTERFRDAVTPREQFCRQYDIDPCRPIVTWATAYQHAEVDGAGERAEKFQRETEETGFADCYRKIGLDPSAIPHHHARSRAAATSAFLTLIAAMPEVQFIIRPHPAENREYYRAMFSGRNLPNVRFCPRDYIWNIISASDVHLHRHCTTAVEAWMWDKPTVEMEFDPLPQLAWQDREEGSDIASSGDALISIVGRYLSGERISPSRAAHRHDYIRTWFGPADGTRCRAAADAIDQLGSSRRPRRRSFLSLAEVPVPFRQVAAATVRYGLARPPNASLFSRRSAAESDPQDKQITRRDVVRYAARVRNAVT